MAGCRYLDRCEFLKKFHNTGEYDCEELMQRYCQGPRVSECARHRFIEENGRSPVDGLLPTGERLPHP